MPGPGRPTVQIQLTAEERETLQRWARRHTSAQALALRCRIVLACAEDRTNLDVAAELGVHKVTVSKWRRRFAAERLEGLTDAPRPGAARRIGDDVVEAIVVETLETAPKDAPTGRRVRWRPSTASADRRSRRSGGRSGSSHGARTSSRSPRTPTWSRRSATWSACT